MNYNNNTSSGHVRKPRQNTEPIYAEERRELAWQEALKRSKK